MLQLLAGDCSGKCSCTRAPGSATAPHRPPAATRRRRHSLPAARQQAGAAAPAAMAAPGTASTTKAAARTATASAGTARSARSAGGVAGAGFCGGGVCGGWQRGAHQVLRHLRAPWLYRQGEGDIVVQSQEAVRCNPLHIWLYGWLPTNRPAAAVTVEFSCLASCADLEALPMLNATHCG